MDQEKFADQSPENFYTGGENPVLITENAVGAQDNRRFYNRYYALKQRHLDTSREKNSKLRVVLYTFLPLLAVALGIATVLLVRSRRLR